MLLERRGKAGAQGTERSLPRCLSDALSCPQCPLRRLPTLLTGPHRNCATPPRSLAGRGHCRPTSLALALTPGRLKCWPVPAKRQPRTRHGLPFPPPAVPCAQESHFLLLDNGTMSNSLHLLVPGPPPLAETGPTVCLLCRTWCQCAATAATRP